MTEVSANNKIVLNKNWYAKPEVEAFINDLMDQKVDSTPAHLVNEISSLNLKIKELEKHKAAADERINARIRELNSYKDRVRIAIIDADGDLSDIDFTNELLNELGLDPVYTRGVIGINVLFEVDGLNSEVDIDDLASEIRDIISGRSYSNVTIDDVSVDNTEWTD